MANLRIVAYIQARKFSVVWIGEEQRGKKRESSINRRSLDWEREKAIGTICSSMVSSFGCSWFYQIKNKTLVFFLLFECNIRHVYESKYNEKHQGLETTIMKSIMIDIIVERKKNRVNSGIDMNVYQQVILLFLRFSLSYHLE